MPKTITIPGVGDIDFPDDMDDAQIAQAAQRLTAEHAPSAQSPRQPPPEYLSGPGESAWPSAEDEAGRTGSWTGIQDALPMLGAMGATAGLTGGVGLLPMAVAAGLGGAGGAGVRSILRQLSSGEPASAGQVAREMGGEGVQQALLQAGPAVALKAAGAVAPRLYQSALKPSFSLRQQFPGLVKQGLEEGVPVGFHSAEKAGAKLGQAGQATRDAIAAAEQGGAPGADPTRVIEALEPVFDTIAKRRALGEAVDADPLFDRVTHFARGGPIPLTRAQALKTEAQDLAAAAYRAQERGGVVNSLDLQTHEGIASGLRQGIEEQVPGVRAMNQRTQNLIGLKRALENREGQLSNRDAITGRLIMAGLLGGTTGLASQDPGKGAAVGLGSLLLNSPAMASRAAIGLNRVSQASPAVSSNLLRAALLSLMNGGSEPTP